MTIITDNILEGREFKASVGAQWPFLCDPGRKVQQVRQDLREVTRKIRPDWDPGAAGLRDAWDAGDKSGFWPYDDEAFQEIEAIVSASHR